MVLGCRLAVKPYLTRKGRFSLGRLSTPVTWIAFIWAVVAVFVFTLPTEWPIKGNLNLKTSTKWSNNRLFFCYSASNFNYSGLALLGTMAMTMTFWYTYGAKHYVGPRASNDEI